MSKAAMTVNGRCAEHLASGGHLTPAARLRGWGLLILFALAWHPLLLRLQSRARQPITNAP